MSNKAPLPTEFKDLEGNELTPRELKGIGKAINEYKRDILHLHKMPISADCAQEIIDAEVLFRKAISNDILSLIEINCANCPAGYEKSSCQAKSCPFQAIEKILKTRLNELNKIRPGGI